MSQAAKNSSLNRAKDAKQDEFYTQLADIERELRHYKKHFRRKTVYCNCDDPRVSNFFHYFSFNFERLGLKSLISTCYRNKNLDLFSRLDSDSAIMLEYRGDKNGNCMPDLDEIEATPLRGDGDFRSAECMALLDKADVVVTNPPFSLFREYMGQLIDAKKKFLILGNQGAITYKEIFPLIQENKIWLGYHNGDMEFRVPDHYQPRKTRFRMDETGQKWRSFGNMCWYTNLDIAKRHEDLVLYKEYDPDEYPRYANFDGIEVGKTSKIPVDFQGAMGVPITFLGKHNPEQFEILGSSRTLGVPMSQVAEKGSFTQGGPRFYLRNADGTYRRLYDRIVIRNKRL